jgi:hypothetical protein
MQVKNGCVCLAYESGTDAYHDHTLQFLMRMLSISIKIPDWKGPLHMLSMRIRNWCVHWPVHQELICALSVQARNWCARSACASEIKCCIAPQKIKVTSSVADPDPDVLFMWSLIHKPKFRSLCHCCHRGMFKKGFNIYLWKKFGKSTLLTKNI